jgi:hypothetical protein
MDQSLFEEAQNKLRNYSKSSKIDINIHIFGNIFDIIKGILADNFDEFKTEFSIKKTCSNKSCQYNEPLKKSMKLLFLLSISKNIGIAISV